MGAINRHHCMERHYSHMPRGTSFSAYRWTGPPLTLGPQVCPCAQPPQGSHSHATHRTSSSPLPPRPLGHPLLTPPDLCFPSGGLSLLHLQGLLVWPLPVHFLLLPHFLHLKLLLLFCCNSFYLLSTWWTPGTPQTPSPLISERSHGMDAEILPATVLAQGALVGEPGVLCGPSHLLIPLSGWLLELSWE